jgi:hypothetical protein
VDWEKCGWKACGLGEVWMERERDGIEIEDDVVEMERNVLALVAIVFPPRLPSLLISQIPNWME